VRLPSYLSRGLVTVSVAVGLLFAAGALFAPSSISRGAVLGMLPFASVLGIIALGQNLVIMQGGIDLSVWGSVSLAVVITTHQAYGDDSLLLRSVAYALGAAVAAGIVNGILAGRLGLNPIVATLGTNTLLLSAVFGVSGGIPRTTTDLLESIAAGRTIGIPHSVFFAVGATIVTAVTVKNTVSGRRFEAVGANLRAMRATGRPIDRHRIGAYIWAQVLYWLGAVLLAGILKQPTAFQGEEFLLPSVAAVVLGGTSLLGGRGHLVATVVAALFLEQLNQFVLALGVGFASRTLVQAGALVVGIALYTFDWSSLRRHGADDSESEPPTPAPATPAGAVEGTAGAD